MGALQPSAAVAARIRALGGALSSRQVCGLHPSPLRPTHAVKGHHREQAVARRARGPRPGPFRYYRFKHHNLNSGCFNLD